MTGRKRNRPDEQTERMQLDALFDASRMYKSGPAFQKLLEFTARLSKFAPFNAMLLHVQKPGMQFAASAHEWETEFGRRPKDGARPLLILWPFGPVALVYDLADTEGDELHADTDCFFARGPVTAGDISGFMQALMKHHVQCSLFDGGDGYAGSIRPLSLPSDIAPGMYKLLVNQNHSAPVQFATLAHELAHLYLGHLGADRKLRIPLRRPLDHTTRELEAESVAYLVCKRNQVELKSQTYLSSFVDQRLTVDCLEVYQIMRAAGRVEDALVLASHTAFA